MSNTITSISISEFFFSFLPVISFVKSAVTNLKRNATDIFKARNDRGVVNLLTLLYQLHEELGYEVGV